jgi:hypothetical protein
MRRDRKPKINQLERRGYSVNPEFLVEIDSAGMSRLKDIEVIGRRTRKIWDCKAGDACPLGKIDLDEVYVEITGEDRYTGKADRWHVACALRAGIIMQEKNSLDMTNNRRAAIEEAKARKETAC